jgi:hypothetical protein
MVQVDAEAYFRTPWALEMLTQSIAEWASTHCCSEYHLEMRQPRSFSVECQCSGTACPGIKRANQGNLELAGSALYGKGRLEDLLFVLHFKRICRKKVFDTEQSTLSLA